MKRLNEIYCYLIAVVISSNLKGVSVCLSCLCVFSESRLLLMALRSPVYKPSALPRRGASPLVGEQLVGRRWLAERCTLADADLHTYWWRERHQMRRTVRIWLVRVSVSLWRFWMGAGRWTVLRLNQAKKSEYFMIKTLILHRFRYCMRFYLHVKYLTLLFYIEADVR